MLSNSVKPLLVRGNTELSLFFWMTPADTSSKCLVQGGVNERAQSTPARSCSRWELFHPGSFGEVRIGSCWRELRDVQEDDSRVWDRHVSLHGAGAPSGEDPQLQHAISADNPHSR